MRLIDLFSASKVLAGDWVRVVPFLPKGYWRGGSSRPPIDEENILTLVANFEKRAERGPRQTQIPFNIEHDERGGRIGWLRAMKAILDGSEDAGAYAQIELTEAGKERLASGEFAYLSPEIVWAFQDPETNEDIGPVLVGLAATNYPFFGDKTAMYSERVIHGFEDMAFAFCESSGWEQGDLTATPLDALLAVIQASSFMDETSRRRLMEIFAVTKRAGDGKDYPASAFIIVPDSSKPTTWKLRFKEYVDGRLQVTRGILSKAAQAVGPKGFRGERVQLSPGDMAKAKKRILAEYRKLGVAKAEIPTHLYHNKGDSDMSDELTLTREDLTFLQRLGAMFSRGGNAENDPPADGDAAGGLQQAMAEIREEMSRLRDQHATELSARDDQIEQLRGSLSAADDARMSERFAREAEGFSHLGMDVATAAGHLRWLYEADNGGEHYTWFSALLVSADEALADSAAFKETGSTHRPLPSSPVGEFEQRMAAKATEMFGRLVKPGEEDYLAVMQAVAQENPDLYRRATQAAPGQPK